MWEMVSGGDIPWHDKTNAQIVELVGHLKLKLHVSKATLQLYPQVDAPHQWQRVWPTQAHVHARTHARTHARDGILRLGVIHQVNR
jgi:hypothetical protein